MQQWVSELVPYLYRRDCTLFLASRFSGASAGANRQFLARAGNWRRFTTKLCGLLYRHEYVYPFTHCCRAYMGLYGTYVASKKLCFYYSHVPAQLESQILRFP